MFNNPVIRALFEFNTFRTELFDLYRREQAVLESKSVPWSMGTTWGYWLKEWDGMRPAAERSAASIGEDEIKLFFDCCQILQPRLTYIIGNSFGLSTFVFALAFPGQQVVAIDNWSEPGIGELTRKLSERIVEQKQLTNVKLVTGTSPQDTAAAVGGSPISIAFIDGLHRNPAARADYEGLKPFLAADSVVFWHNVNDTPTAFESAFAEHGSTLFDRKLVLRTHGPLGVFFSSTAHPALETYFESCRLAWPDWQQSVAMFLDYEDRERRRKNSRLRKIISTVAPRLAA